MAKQSETESTSGQPYDSALKALFEDQLKEMLTFLIEAKAEGITEGLQKALVTVIEGRFPPLKVLAQERVTHIKTADTLNVLLKGVISAPDEATARWLLDTFAA